MNNTIQMNSTQISRINTVHTNYQFEIIECNVQELYVKINSQKYIHKELYIMRLFGRLYTVRLVECM